MKLCRFLTVALLGAGVAGWLMAMRKKEERTFEKRPVEKKVAAPETIYHGNPDSNVFHAPQCRYYNSAGCTEKFAGREAALQADYKPCGLCTP